MRKPLSRSTGWKLLTQSESSGGEAKQRLRILPLAKAAR